MYVIRARRKAPYPATYIDCYYSTGTQATSSDYLSLAQVTNILLMCLVITRYKWYLCDILQCYVSDMQFYNANGDSY